MNSGWTPEISSGVQPLKHSTSKATKPSQRSTRNGKKTSATHAIKEISFPHGLSLWHEPYTNLWLAHLCKKKTAKFPLPITRLQKGRNGPKTVERVASNRKFQDAGMSRVLFQVPSTRLGSGLLRLKHQNLPGRSQCHLPPKKHAP